MQRTVVINRIVFGLAALVAGAAVLAGCGGGGSNSGGNSLGGSLGGDVEKVFGRLIARITGNSQPPINAKGSTGLVTAVAGTSLNSLIVDRSIPAPFDIHRIAFAAIDGQIYTVSASGGTVTQITTTSQVKTNPSWSPDGAHIAYQSKFSDFDVRLMTIPSNGGMETQLTDGTQSVSSPSWSPDGKSIAFSGNGLHGTYQIYTVPSAGGTPAPVTTGDDDKFDPCWSPDGAQIAYDSYTAGQFEIFTVPAAGGTQSKITIASEQQAKTEPAWSPDGSRIAYHGGGNDQLFTVPAGGGSSTPITTGGTAKSSPSWFLDGTQIAFGARDSVGRPEIFTVPSTGGMGAKLTTNSPLAKYTPALPMLLVGPKPIQMLGADGLLGTAGAGFLSCRDADTVRSVMAFDTAAGTPESRRTTSVTVGVSGDIAICTIKSDDNLSQPLSQIKYVTIDNTSGTAMAGKVIAPSMSEPTAGALFTFSVATGNVTTFLPLPTQRAATAVRGGATRVVQQGTELVLNGPFLAVIDAAGTNRAVHGASEVRVDSRTGELIAFK